MTFWRTICYCHSRFADRELLFINLDETSVGHTMTPPIGCVAKPRTAGGKQPHAQVLKQHVRGAWTYLCQRDLQLQAHPREVASFFHWHPGETHEEALARPARFATNSFACFAAKVRLDLCCQQCPNSQRDRRSAEKFSVKTRRCTPWLCAGTPATAGHGNGTQVQAAACIYPSADNGLPTAAWSARLLPF